MFYNYGKQSDERAEARRTLFNELEKILAPLGSDAGPVAEAIENMIRVYRDQLREDLREEEQDREYDSSLR